MYFRKKFSGAFEYMDAAHGTPPDAGFHWAMVMKFGQGRVTSLHFAPNEAPPCALMKISASSWTFLSKAGVTTAKKVAISNGLFAAK